MHGQRSTGKQSARSKVKGQWAKISMVKSNHESAGQSFDSWVVAAVTIDSMVVTSPRPGTKRAAAVLSFEPQ